MASPPEQPTVVDAVRWMDSLSCATRPTTSSLSALTTGSNRPSAVAQSAHLPSDSPHSLEEEPSRRRFTPWQARTTSSSTGSPSSANLPPPRAKYTPRLPAEIIFAIGTHLLPAPTSTASSASFHHGSDLRTSFPCRHAAPPYIALFTPTTSLSNLLALSSASVSFRNALLPLVWHTIVIRTPQHLPRLATLLREYDTLSVRSNSPTSRRRRDSSPSPLRPHHAADRESGGDAGGLGHPLSHIRSVCVSIPDKYADVDQSYLLTLLRSISGQVRHLYWSAEAAPNPAMWTLLAPSLTRLEVDGRTFYHGHAGWAKLERLKVLKMTAYDSTLLPIGAVAVFRAQSQDGDDGVGGAAGLDEVPGSGEGEATRETPLVELQRVLRSPRRQARHLYLDPTPRDDSLPRSEPICTGSIASRVRLEHLSLSASKTSLLHQRPLIASGAFRGLTCLDLYAVTPEPPLADALLSAGHTLTHLRLVLDISGAFANFDALWTALTGGLPQLVWLEIDPMPQQNTAPSFWSFVEACGRLQAINGRKVDSFPPCFGAFDPDHSSGALPF